MSIHTIIDLSASVDASLWEPQRVRRQIVDHKRGGDILGRSYDYFKAASWSGRIWRRIRRAFGGGIGHKDFPDQMGLSTMTYELTTHTGTHLDAPFHYGLGAPDGVAATIEKVPLEWCYGRGVVIDLSANSEFVGAIGRAEIETALAAIDHQLSEGEIVLIRTGAEDRNGTADYFARYRGVSVKAIDYMLDSGVRVIGTDAFSFDPPFCEMLDSYEASKDRNVLWPAHVLGRKRPYIQIERVTGLGALPAPTGFMVACFPIKLTGADAAWSRVVAIC
jgi:kynurenine formamidase